MGFHIQLRVNLVKAIGSFVRKIKEKNTSAELSGCRTVLVSKCLTQVPNCPGAELSWCRNVSHRCRSVLVPNCPGAEMSSIRLLVGTMMGRNKYTINRKVWYVKVCLVVNTAEILST